MHAGLERGVREDTWARVCALMGRPELADDPKFNTREALGSTSKSCSHSSTWTATRPKEEITIPSRDCALLPAMWRQLLTAPAVNAREFFQCIDHPDVGTATYPGAPFTIQGAAWQQARAPRG